MSILSQQKFLWETKKVNPISITQTANDTIMVELRANIFIVHKWRENSMELIIRDDQSHYVIPDQKALEDIYEIHTNNENITQLVKEYADANLEKC